MLSQNPQRWWLLVAGVSFAIVALVSLWVVGLVLNLPNSRTSSSIFFLGSSLSIGTVIGAFLAGSAAWWVGFHLRSRFLATGASVGAATGLVCLVLNPLSWIISAASLFLFPILFFSLCILTGVALEIAQRISWKPM